MGGSTVTFRLPWGPRTHRARPMLADAAIDGRWPAAPEYSSGRFPAFFWRFADGDYNGETFRDPYSEMALERLWQPSCNNGYDLGKNHGAFWYVGGDDRYPDPKMHVEQAFSRAEHCNGNRWLVIGGADPGKMPPTGAGWWTPWLAACPGARTTVSLKIYAKDVRSSHPAPATVFMQFISATGQKRSRAFIIGQQPDGTPRRRELLKGSYGWTPVSEIITAPENAVRMALFLGIQPCQGEVGFDDINIKTEDGVKSREEAQILEPAPTQIPKERLREIIRLNLSQQANRPLVDTSAAGGRVGWLGLGANLDMRNLTKGDRLVGTVPFTILSGGNEAIVLRGDGKAGANLPTEITVPVGRAFDALYFLVAAAFVKDTWSDLLQITVNYTDGTSSGWGASCFNLADWLEEPVVNFRHTRLSTAAFSVPLGGGKMGTCYRIEWILDRAKRGLPIKSITFRSKGTGVPVILGVTGVTQW
jgi:hypothetical protein